MYFGGALFDTFEKFVEFYTYTKKMKKSFVPEDTFLKGLGLANLHNLVVLRDEGVIYTPTPFGLIDEHLIDEFVNLSDDIAEDLIKILPPRSIV
jgi:hypothetical protein